MNILPAVATALLLGVGAAGASTLDFNGGTPCTSTDAFVTLSTVGTATCQATIAPTTNSGAIGIFNSGTPGAMRADFGGLVSFVSIDLGDYNADPDNIFLEVFGIDDVSLGLVDFLRPGASFAMDTLSIAVANISYAVFGTNAADLGFIAADNLSYRTATVPLPAAGLLLLGGLGAFGVAARRRKTA